MEGLKPEQTEILYNEYKEKKKERANLCFEVIQELRIKGSEAKKILGVA